MHSASVGEALIAFPVIRSLRKYYPKVSIIFTSITPAAMKLAESEFGKEIQYSYFPYDLSSSVKRFINYIQPKLVIVMETELWPNFINLLYNKKIPLIIANARLSSHSFHKYCRFSFFIKLIMQRITFVAAQNKSDAFRFLHLGVKRKQLSVIGNLKFDISINKEFLKEVIDLKKRWVKDRLVWIAGSTHSGEEIILLKAHKILLKKFPNLLMIIAPRHPERFFKVKKIVKKYKFSYITKSSGDIPSKETQVIINDTIGKLMLLYGISNLAFIGGSLIKHGGHNPLEPAAFGIPLLMGPNMFNFLDICKKLNESHGLVIVDNVDSLVEEISVLLINEESRFYYGFNAFEVLKNNQGALSKLFDLLKVYLSF